MKVRELKEEDVHKLCKAVISENPARGCIDCPFKLVDIKTHFLRSDLNYNENSFSYCLANLVGILDQEIDV